MDGSQNYAFDSDCIPQRDSDADYPEWFEDASSEAEWAGNFSLQRADSSISVGGSVRSITLLDELYEKNKVLEREWREAERKYQNLQVENQKLTIQLANERHRSNKYLKKLQYIQDNHEIFNRLKQAYLNMKYYESTGRPMVEIRETACQTWDGILCQACIETGETQRKIDLERLRKLTNGEMVTVKKTHLSNLQNSVLCLKNMVDVREESWSFNTERERQYRSTIAQLQGNIQILNTVIVERQDRYPLIPPSDSNSELIHKENGFLRKIIIKLEKRHRDMEKLYKVEKRACLLNDQEKQMVQQLIQKYANKLKEKITRNVTIICDAPATFDNAGPVRSPRMPRTMLKMPELSNVSNPILGGIGEAIVLNVPVPKMRRSIAVEEAEKPLSPRPINQNF